MTKRETKMNKELTWQYVVLLVAVVVGVITLTAGCGRDGAQGWQGSAGSNGQSIVGPQGAPGVNATPVTFVKFCPGDTVYPSKFVEGGFCLSGKLYGTYSDHGGFSTEIPPGYYGSNGINASCNFTVLPNCGIQN